MGKLSSPEIILAEDMDSFQREVQNYIDAKNNNDPAKAVEAYNAYYNAFNEIKGSSMLFLKDIKQIELFLKPLIDHQKVGKDMEEIFIDIIKAREFCRDYVPEKQEIES